MDITVEGTDGVCASIELCIIAVLGKYWLVNGSKNREFCEYSDLDAIDRSVAKTLLSAMFSLSVVDSSLFSDDDVDKIVVMVAEIFGKCSAVVENFFIEPVFMTFRSASFFISFSNMSTVNDVPKSELCSVVRVDFGTFDDV